MVRIGKFRLYLETTVFNYYFDTDRKGHKDVVRLFGAIGVGLIEGYGSVVICTAKEVLSHERQDIQPNRG